MGAVKKVAGAYIAMRGGRRIVQSATDKSVVKSLKNFAIGSAEVKIGMDLLKDNRADTKGWLDQGIIPGSGEGGPLTISACLSALGAFLGIAICAGIVYLIVYAELVGSLELWLKGLPEGWTILGGLLMFILGLPLSCILVLAIIIGMGYLGERIGEKIEER